MRIKPFTGTPEDVAAYGPVTDEDGTRRFDVEILEVRGGMVVAGLAGISDRNAAEALKGLRLYVLRAELPAPDEDEFYHADLLGLAVVGTNDAPVGTVRAIIPAGATEVLEIDRGPGEQTLLVPFTRAAVPEVNIAAGRIVIDPPEEVETERDDDLSGGAPNDGDPNDEEPNADADADADEELSDAKDGTEQ